jgi:hypothetical protein
VSSRHFSTLASLGLAYAPGFLLPFVVRARMHDYDSDLLLIVLAAATAVASVVSLTLESAWSTWVVRMQSRPMPLTFSIIPSGLVIGCLFSVLALPALLTLFASTSDQQLGDLIELGLLALPYVFCMGYAGYLGGISIALGKVRWNLATQSTRMIFGLSAIFVAPSPQHGAIVGLALGEMLRVLLLVRICRPSVRLIRPGSVVLPAPEVGQLVAIAIGQIVGTASLLVDRAFLLSFSPGTLTDFETSDRVYFAANQIVVTLFVLVAVASWNASTFESWTDGRQRIATCLVATSGVAVAAAAATALGGLIVVDLGIMSSRAVMWALLLLIGLPPAATIVLIGRLAIGANAARMLPALAITMIMSTVVLDYLGSLLAGPTGVVAATPVARTLTLIVALLSVRRVLLARERAATTVRSS